jgi:hypothetical protein
LFATEFPSETEEWHTESSYVVVLQVPSVAHLTARFSCLPEHSKRCLVREPDLDDEPTAFAVLGHDAGRLLSDLPLALKEVAVA